MQGFEDKLYFSVACKAEGDCFYIGAGIRIKSALGI